jgi:hypothetical protein
MKHTLPSSLRKPEQRHAARATTDAILNTDRRRPHRMVMNDELGGGTAPAVKKYGDGPFAVLRDHPLYRAPRYGAHRP